ncbi:MAG: hypothetical protein ACLRVS_05240 [Lachnospiraceae bacterium]
MKKVFAVLLTAIMIFSLVSFPAYATGSDNSGIDRATAFGLEEDELEESFTPATGDRLLSEIFEDDETAYDMITLNYYISSG